LILDEDVLGQWTKAQLKDKKPNHFDDLQDIAALYPQLTEAIADDPPKTALKCHFVAYIHVDGQLIEFGRFLNNFNCYLIGLLCLDSSQKFVRHCGTTTPSALIKDAADKVNEITEEVENEHMVAMAFVAD
jgi:hypothetical protein